jgi:hypothetical protein
VEASDPLRNIDALVLVCATFAVPQANESLIMKVSVSVDVPSIDDGLKFFREAFGFIEFSRPHPGYAMLSAGEAMIGLLANRLDRHPRREAVMFAGTSVTGHLCILIFALKTLRRVSREP